MTGMAAISHNTLATLLEYFLTREITLFGSGWMVFAKKNHAEERSRPVMCDYEIFSAHLNM